MPRTADGEIILPGSANDARGDAPTGGMPPTSLPFGCGIFYNMESIRDNFRFPPL